MNKSYRPPVSSLIAAALLFVAVVALIEFSGHQVHAQQGRLGARVGTTAAGTHTVTLGWTNAAITGVNADVSRATCSAAISGGVCPTANEGTFVKIAGPLAAATFTDSAVVGNTNYSYYVTSICPTGGTCPSNYPTNTDSAPSNHVGVAVPPDALPAPTGLAVTGVS